VSTMFVSGGASTRRAALLAALSGSIGGFSLPGASARKKRQKKRKRCPSACPARVACACTDVGTCTYLPFAGNLNEVSADCQARCGGGSGFQALVSGPTSAASCTIFGGVAPVQCPLV
jgi:hypothetical protein